MRPTRVPFALIVALLIIGTGAVAFWRLTTTPTSHEAAAPLPAPTPAATPTPEATSIMSEAPDPAAVRDSKANATGTGELLVAPGKSQVAGEGKLLRFIVAVEDGIDVDPAAFATRVEGTLLDRRGWTQSFRLQRVPEGTVNFRVVLASTQTAVELCAPLDMGESWSCYRAGRVVLGTVGWFRAADALGLNQLRHYLINHEVGHALGLGDRHCTRSAEPAPVMVEQTEELGRCLPNAWPLAVELRRALPTEG